MTHSFSTSTSPILSSLPHLVTVKLTNDNYLLWRTQLLPYFHGQRLFGYIDGSTPCLAKLQSDGVTMNLSFLSWYQQDQVILSAIISSLSEPLIAQVIGQTSSYSAWLKLENLFTSKSQARLVYLQYQLAILRKNTDSIPVYYNKVELMVDTLATAGKSLTDTEFTTYLLAGLRLDFDSLVTSITTRVDPATCLCMKHACHTILPHTSLPIFLPNSLYLLCFLHPTLVVGFKTNVEAVTVAVVVDHLLLFLIIYPFAKSVPSLDTLLLCVTIGLTSLFKLSLHHLSLPTSQPFHLAPNRSTQAP